MLSDAEAEFFRQADPFGFILFARNCVSPDQLSRLTEDLRSAVGWTAPILIDQEGGRVQRMRAPAWREFLPPLEQVQRAGPAAGRAMYLRACLIGAELREVGIDVNCIPTCDIAGPATHPFLRNRCYGEDADTVIEAAEATVAGLAEAGVLPVMKHAPGHGRASADSHHSLPAVSAPVADLTTSEFRPFKALSDLPFVMTAHLVLSDIDRTRPVTQSPAGISLLRDTLGLSGFLMTDDISMNALTGTVVQRGKAALAAGCDAVLHCNGDVSEMRRLAEELGPLSPAAAARGEAALAARRAPAAIDIRAIEAELETLQMGDIHA